MRPDRSRDPRRRPVRDARVAVDARPGGYHAVVEDYEDPDDEGTGHIYEYPGDLGYSAVGKGYRTRTRAQIAGEAAVNRLATGMDPYERGRMAR